MEHIIRLDVVYRPDGYGGVEKCELDYKQNVVCIRGELADEYEGVVDFFKRNKIFMTLTDCCRFIEQGNKDGEWGKWRI